MYYISQVVELFVLIISLYSYHLKTKKSIFKCMCVANVLDIIHYFFLNASSGVLTKFIALIRNVFILKKEDNEILKSNVFLVLFVITYVVFAFISFKGIYSLLPFISAIIYMCVVWNGNELQIKRIAFFCYFFWLVYNVSIYSIVGIVSSIVGLISTYIAYIRFRKVVK